MKWQKIIRAGPQKNMSTRNCCVYVVADYAEILYDDEDEDMTGQPRSEVLAPEAASPNVSKDRCCASL